MNGLLLLAVMHLNSQKVFELFKILHLIFFVQCCLKILNANYIFLKDDEIIHFYSNDDFCIFINIDTGIRIGLVKVNELEISPDLLISHSWYLLQLIQTFDEPADYVLVSFISFRLLHVYLLLQFLC